MLKGISIIIPVYNRECFIGKAIESILSQTNDEDDFEIVISDDGSSDNSIEIARSYGEKIVIVEKPLLCKKQGAASARNRGILVAKYAYIAFLDSDDIYLPGYLKMMSNYLDNNLDKGFVFCRSKKKIINSDGTETITHWTRLRIGYFAVKYNVLYRSYIINTNTVFSRREVFDLVGVFNPKYITGEDSDLWMRMSEKFDVGFIDTYGTCYVEKHQSEQLTKNDNKQKKEFACSIILSALERNFTNENRDPIRLLLIVRQLLYLNRTAEGKFYRIINHIIVTIKLFAIFPSTTLTFLKLTLRKN